jgi:hypothetical protein
MEPIVVDLEVDGVTEKDLAHDGEEFGLVLKGKIELTVGKRTYIVNKNESFYFDPNAKKPSPEEQTEAFRQAQDNMKATAEKNPALMANAKANAKELLRNYVNSVGEAIGVQYTIEWKDIEDQSKVPDVAPPTESSAAKK